MPYLKFYTIEKQVFNKETCVFFTDTHALKICKKLARHFKFELEKVRFLKMRRSAGRATLANSSITLMHGPSILVICHELAHLYQYQKTGKTYHGKKLLSIIRRMLAYCESKGWWISESVIAERMIERNPKVFSGDFSPQEKSPEEAPQT